MQHVCSGISGLASVRLLRVDSACSAECQQLQCSIAARISYSTLKVHAQCAQGMCSWELLFDVYCSLVAVH